MVSNNQVKIQVAEINDFKNIIKALEDKKTEFHTFKPKQERSYNVFLKGIHNSAPIIDIKKELEGLEHEAVNISNVRDWVTKKPLQLFYVSLKQKPNN